MTESMSKGSMRLNEGAMTEWTQRFSEAERERQERQAWQLNRGLTEKVLDRAASDPQWKQQLIDDPEAALRQANFPELQQIQQIQQDAQAAQWGQHPSWETGHHPGWQCTWWSQWWG